MVFQLGECTFGMLVEFVKPGHEEDLRQLLVKASGIYKKDKHTIDWFIAQNKKEPTKFTAVERYTSEEDGLKEHASNPFFKEFGEAAKPWLAKPVELIYNSEL
ncbi:hypothetical protein CF335_g1864 [Tilletia laevis]|nr:hypothetical protein CF335_g1864 [Tilletia laevis]